MAGYRAAILFNLNLSKEITVEVKGAGYLQGFGSADPQSTQSYSAKSWMTYGGYLLAVIRAGEEKGTIYVTFSAEGCNDMIVEIQVV